MRDLLADLGLPSAPMVTGGKGIHVVVNLNRRATQETVIHFSRAVATLLATREPERFVATMSKAKRTGRIFIDWLRNQRGATAICPFSIRARPGARVAVPVGWDELEGLGSARAFGLAEAAERAASPLPLSRLAGISADTVRRLDRLAAS